MTKLQTLILDLQKELIKIPFPTAENQAEPDMADLGNAIGVVIGGSICGQTDPELTQFLYGLEHGLGFPIFRRRISKRSKK